MKETLFRMTESKPLDHGRLQYLQEGLTMDPVFVEKQSFQVVGMEMHSSEGYEFGSVRERFVPRMEEIEKKANPDPIFYGVIEPTGVKREFTYMACVEVSGKANIPKGMVYKVIPSSSYAVFTHKGSLNGFVVGMPFVPL